MSEWFCAAPAQTLVRQMREGSGFGTNSDEALAARVQTHGDTDAFALLVIRYRARVVALARRMLNDGYSSGDDAEDVAQEAFIAAYAKRHTYRRGEPFRPWLYRIALNRCRDRQRAQSRRPAQREWQDAESESAGQSPGPLQSLLTGEQEARLQDAVAALPAKYRVVFLLRHLDDLSYEEIAHVTDQPMGTVKTQLFRSRVLLRAALGAEWGGNES